MGEDLNLTISPFLINFFSLLLFSFLPHIQTRNSVMTVAGLVMKMCVNYLNGLIR